MSGWRRRLTAGVAAVAVVAAAGAPSVAAGSSKVERVAKKAASRYVEKFGISLSPSQWVANCHKRSSAKWHCNMIANGGQCGGDLFVVKRHGKWRATKTKIGCGE